MYVLRINCLHFAGERMDTQGAALSHVTGQASDDLSQALSIAVRLWVLEVGLTPKCSNLRVHAG